VVVVGARLAGLRGLWWLEQVEERLRESHGVGEVWCMVLESGLLSHWSIDSQSSFGKQLVWLTVQIFTQNTETKR
jgi:hypothetical protein